MALTTKFSVRRFIYMLQVFIKPYLIKWAAGAITCLLIWTLPVYSQSTYIYGRLRDTVQHIDCSQASIALQGRDSANFQFARSKTDGTFLLKGIPPGKYTIKITHLSYSDLKIAVQIAGPAPVNMGVLPLSPKVDSLTPVTVTPDHLRPRMNGDTLEYNTSGIKLRMNASVEQLLRLLPGIQIDPTGQITVNGQKVSHLLVDGEDFFGGNPTVATKNLNADMIDKVQILDKKSRLAEITGMDDGQTTKTLNLSLKAADRRSYLVNGEVGGGTQGYYNLKGLACTFQGSRQVAAIGLLSNTGNSGYSNSSGGLDAGLSVGLTTNDALGSSAGTGIPQTGATGVHFADKWGAEQDHLSGNAQYGHLLTRPFSFSQTEQTLPDTIYSQNQQSSSINAQTQVGMNIDFDFHADSLSFFHASLMTANMQGNNQYNASASSYFNDTLVNASQRAVHSQVSNSQAHADIIYAIHGRKQPKRQFFVSFGLAEQNNTTNGFLYSPTSYYNKDTLTTADTVDERKSIMTNDHTYTGAIGFTQPLWRHAIVVVRSSVSFDRNQSIQSTFNKGDGKYQDYIDSLSSNYKSNILTQATTLNIQFKERKLFYTIGINLSNYSYKQNDLLSDRSLKYHYVNVTPRVSAGYDKTPFVGIKFDYEGTTQQPSVTQLQPVINNNDPLHVTLGNPHLLPSLTHTASLDFHSFKSYNILVQLRAALTTNNISTKTYTDSLGRQVSQSENINGNYNAELFGSLNRKLFPSQIDVSLVTHLSYTHANNFVDTYLSRNNNYNGTWGVVLSKYLSEKFNVQATANVGYIYSSSSINAVAAIHYLTQGHNLLLSFFPASNWEINTVCSYTWQEKSGTFDKNTSTLWWNAFISRTYFKSKLTLRLQVNNILNQNAGVTRSNMVNQTSQTTSNAIGRYYMVALAFKINRRSGK
jgi:hypothetical protein